MKTSRFYKLARYIEISQEIKNAFEIKRPIVALESAIITHGMPHPYNVDTALEVEHIVREQVTTRHKSGFSPLVQSIQSNRYSCHQLGISVVSAHMQEMFHLSYSLVKV